MGRFIALYRGINVGGRNSVKMDALRAMHEALGHSDVTNYIQSGNILFSARGKPDAIARACATRSTKEFGFTPQVLIVTATRFRAIVRDNPYAKAAAKAPQTVHAALCDGKPSATGLRALLTKTAGPEKFEVGDDVFYVHAPDGFGTSKFAAGMERALRGLPITVRNWRTIETLHNMLADAASSNE